MRNTAIGLTLGIIVGVMSAVGIAYGDHGEAPIHDSDFWDWTDSHHNCDSFKAADGSQDWIAEHVCDEIERVAFQSDSADAATRRNQRTTHALLTLYNDLEERLEQLEGHSHGPPVPTTTTTTTTTVAPS